MTRRLFGLPLPPVERAEIISRVALPSLREGAAVLLRSPSAALRAAAAISPVLRRDPRAAPVLRELARGTVVTDSVALLARNPGAPPDIAALCSQVCETAEQSSAEWWHHRAWLAGLAGLAHLGHPDAITRAGAALEAWQESSHKRWVDTDGIGAAMLALGAMGPRLQRYGRLCRRLEDLHDIPQAAFPLAAAGDRLALRQLAEHPETAPLVLAFSPEATADALSRSLTISDSGSRAMELLMRHQLGEKGCRALVEQAAAQLLAGDGDEVTARIIAQGITLLPVGWRTPLLYAPSPPTVRRQVLAALARSPGEGAAEALAIMMLHSDDVDWAELLPADQPGVEAIIRRHSTAIDPTSPAAHRARRTRMLLSLEQPPASLVAAQLRYGRQEAIAAALRLPDAVLLLSDALRRRRIWRSDAATYRFRRTFSEAAGDSAGRAILQVMAGDRDLRVSMFADEALRGLSIPAPVDYACPGTAGWLTDFQAQGYLSMAA